MPRPRRSRYWSAIESNAQLPELSGYLLSNRVLWLAVSIVLLTLTFVLFKPQRLRGSKRARARQKKQPIAAKAQAGLDWDKRKFFVISGLVGLVTGLFAFVLTELPIMALAGLFVGTFGLPRFALNYMRKKEWGTMMLGGALCMGFGIVASFAYALINGNAVDVNTDLGQ